MSEACELLHSRLPYHFHGCSGGLDTNGPEQVKLSGAGTGLYHSVLTRISDFRFGAGVGDAGASD